MRRPIRSPVETGLYLLALASMAMAMASGCRLSGYYLNRPANPLEGVRSIAVAPVALARSASAAGLPALAPEGERLEESLASELVQFPGIEKVIRAGEVRRAMEENEIKLQDESSVRALAQILKVDALLAVEITEYSPYHPPRVGVTAQLFLARQEVKSAAEILAMARSGNAGPIKNFDLGNVLQIERIYDSAQREIRDQAAVYSRGHDFSRETVDGRDRVLWVSDLYLRFVSDRIVTDLFQEYSMRTEEVSQKQS
ncbi:MAG: hypothetical protein HY717_03735 [Planctomycetes bacterium]|nr:hypothetical protein [Planctomycetota bacterium]